MPRPLRRCYPVLVLTVLACSLVLPVRAQTQAPAAQLPPAATTPVDYDKDVKPLLMQNCYSCHGAVVQQSGLRLDLRQNALRGGDYGPVIIPGKSGDSKLIRRLVDGDGGMQMPPAGPLAPDEIGILRAWIDQGAEFRTEIAEAPSKPVDPNVAAAITTVRTKTHEAVEKLVAANPSIVTATDRSGSTLLHHAAGFASIETIKLLLDAGADVNAKNGRGAQPLHWAIHNHAKARLLVSRGANVNAKQVDGRTPLFLAASLPTAQSTVRLLLEHGADPTLTTSNGETPLMVAAARANVDTLALLINKKADVNAKNGAGETALMLAAGNGNPKAVALLLAHGADTRVRTKRNETALGNAATSGVEETVQLLLDRGAEVNVQNIRGFSPLMLAAASDTAPAPVVKLLLAKGANTTYTGDYDEAAADLAAKRGDTEVTRLLGRTPARHNVPVPAVAHARASVSTITVAVEKALGLLEKQSHTFIRTAGCNSCHSQDLVSAAAGLARQRGLRAPQVIAQLPPSMMPPAERIMDLNVVNVGSVGWELFDAGMTGAPANTYTDAIVRYIKAMQTAEGNWSGAESRRPPMNVGDFQFSALAIYALRHYTPAREQASTDQAIARAVAWLERSKPESTQDRAFHLLALVWADAGSATISRSARALAAMQRSDGGWSQLPTLESDAYATGQVLYALNAAGMAINDSIYGTGVEYLLRTQASDGSWHVKSRAIWFQPYFESGFPYGRDQFISAAGTAWASMALTAAVQPRTSTRR